MQEIAFEIDAQRVGRAGGYLGGLTVERYTFTGATIPAGTRLAILTRAGVTIAAAEITEGNAATVDTNTQEVADLLRYQPLGACESVYIAIGSADTIIALIPAVMRKNWLDDEATHPPVPANRYPTKTELDEWLARFDERAAAAENAKADAQEAAAQAAQRAAAAQSAKTAAESAATAAETAQGKAESAQTSAETAQKGAEDAKDAAAQSATAAAQSAKEAAEDVTALLQGKVDAANAAKAGAEAAQTAAETAQGKAESAQTAAASSATAAANSAAAAAKSATDLADAVTTAESFDGRIDALEGGTGVYQYSNGSVEIYQLPTRGAKHLKALKRLDCGLESVIPIDVKFTGVYIAQRDVNLCAYGEYTVVHYEPNLYNTVSRLLIFDKSFNQVLRLAGFNGQKSPSGHGYIHNGRYVRMIEAYRNNGTASVRVYELGTNALLKEITIPRLPTDTSSHYNTSILFNPKTGHTVLVYIRYAPTWQSATSPHRNPYYTSELYKEMGERSLLWGRVIVLDENLSPVLDDAGEEVVYDLTPQELDALKIRATLSTNLVRGNLYAWSPRSEVGAFPVGLLTIDENDRLVPVYESFPVVDENGYIVFATEEVTGSDGTTTTKYVIDNDNTSGRTCLSPITTFGDTPRQIVFKCYVNDADRPKMTAAKAWRTMPMWYHAQGWGYNVTLMMDGVDRYLVMRDGRLVKSWLGSGTYEGKPPVKYEKPLNYDRSSGFTIKGEKIIPVAGGGNVFYMLSLESFADGAFNAKLKIDGENSYGVTHPYECSSLRVSRLLAANLQTLTNAYAAPLGVSAAILAYMTDNVGSYLGGAGLLLADVGNLSGTYA